MPLLHQFIATCDTVRASFFGVSAQGGELPRKADELAEVGQPSKRIRVVTADGETNDITMPIRSLSYGD